MLVVVELINRWRCCHQVGNIGKFLLGYLVTAVQPIRKLACSVYIQYRSSVLEASLSDPYLQRASVGRCFSCLNRVKTFLRNSMAQERLSALALCINRKGILMKLQTESTHMATWINWLICKEKRSTIEFSVQIIIWLFIFYIPYTCNTVSLHRGLSKFWTHHPPLLEILYCIRPVARGGPGRELPELT